MDPILDMETLNLKPNVFVSINVFNIRYKAHIVSWHILQDGNHLFWVLISLLPPPYASVGWQVNEISLRNTFKVINSVCKENDAFLYVKCHPT